MEFERKALSKALADTKAGVSSRLGIPALTGVLVEAGGDGTARLTRTDLECSVTVEVAATGGGRFLVPADLFASAVKAGVGDRVTVEADEHEAKVDGGSIRLLPVEDFPAVAATQQDDLGAVDAVEFSTAAATVLPAASKDESRPVLTGVLIEAEPAGTRFVTTDSYRLHIAEFSAARLASWSGIVPARAIKYVAGRLGRKPSGTVRVFLGEASVSFRFGAIAATVRIIEGEFPNYRQLLPEPRQAGDDGLTLRYNLAAFVAALKAAKPYCGDTSPVRVEFREGGGVFLSASRPEVGSWAHELTGALFEGEPGTAAYNGEYLAASLAAVGEAATVEVRAALKPALMRSADGRRTALLMPVRLPAAVEPVADARRAEERGAAIAAAAEHRPAEVEDQDQDDDEPEVEPVEVEDDDEPYWRCEACGRLEHPDEPVCRVCGACGHGYKRGECHEPACPNVAAVAAEIAGAYAPYIAERAAAVERVAEAVAAGPFLPEPPAVEPVGATVPPPPPVELPPPPEIAAGGAA